MSQKDRTLIYQSFLDFISKDLQSERNRVNRRMLSVLFWCFFLPVLISLAVILLVKLNIFPRDIRKHLDWLILIFPISYSLYILGSEVLAQVPALFRKGGSAAILVQAWKEGVWRDQISKSMRAVVVADLKEWNWVITSFKMDLQAMQYRNNYLTALAGAVFFLLMQGIDSLADSDGPLALKRSMLGLSEASSNDLSQFVGLGLFLVLLYLSGSQTYQSLRRYLNCAELVVNTLEDTTSR